MPPTPDCPTSAKRTRRRAPLSVAVTAAALVLTAAAGLLLAGCCRATPPLDPETVTWHTWTNDTLGYAIDYPEAFEAKRHGDGEVAFSQGLFSVRARVVWVSEEEGRQRGLWPGHPAAGTAQLAGRPAERYVYEHGDGPFVSRTVAYVIPYRDKLLALELRCDGEPDAVQQRMLDSFRLP